jgi:hypothetical protein
VDKEDKAFNEYDGKIEENIEENIENDTKENINFVNGNFTTDSEYVGLTVREFVDKGANIQSSMGFNGVYQFMGVNELTGESFNIILSGDVKSAMENKTLDMEYVDLLGDFVIEKIEIQQSNLEELQQFVGKTIAEFENAGYEINGHVLANNFILYASDNMKIIEITLDETAADLFWETSLNNDGEEIDYSELFANYIIMEINYM